MSRSNSAAAAFIKRSGAVGDPRSGCRRKRAHAAPANRFSQRLANTTAADLQSPPRSACPKWCAHYAEGWHVEADGKLYRTAGRIQHEVSSGVDWFELDGGAEFGETQGRLPRLLRAIKQGEQTVRLDDGSSASCPKSG